MNRKIFLSIIVLLTGFVFASCDDDDDSVAKPEVSIIELGANNSKIGYVGSDLHVEAEINAEGKVDIVTLKILSSSDELIADSTYSDYSGDINPTFHKHIDIPDVEAGNYILQLIVTDLKGQQTTVEEEFAIEIPDDDEAPEVTVSSAPPANQEFTSGQTITISGEVNDNESLAGLYIGLVREDQNLSDAEVENGNTITILHTHDFDEAPYEFTADITVGAENDNDIEPGPKKIEGDFAWQSANYYILVKCKDAAGNWTYSQHYPVFISLLQ